MAIVQVNISMESELATQLDQMARSDRINNRSAFVRWLIGQEYDRRYGQLASPDAVSTETVQPEPITE